MAKTYYKIGIWSAKGGVGKTATSRIIARMMQKAGMRVGVVDMDITNPNLATGMGLPVGKGLHLNGTSVMPYDSDGLKVMSLEFLPESEHNALLFGGKDTVSLAMQLLDVVDWGDIEVLVMDMAPGTGDLTKDILSGMGKKDIVLFVTTPEPEAIADGVKSLDALLFYKVRLMGMIVNKSYVQMKETDVRTPLGASVKEIEARLKVKTLAEIPLCVNGQKIEDYIDIKKIIAASKPRFSLGGL